MPVIFVAGVAVAVTGSDLPVAAAVQVAVQAARSSRQVFIIKLLAVVLVRLAQTGLLLVIHHHLIHAVAAVAAAVSPRALVALVEWLALHNLERRARPVVAVVAEVGVAERIYTMGTLVVV